MENNNNTTDCEEKMKVKQESVDFNQFEICDEQLVEMKVEVKCEEIVVQEQLDKLSRPEFILKNDEEIRNEEIIENSNKLNGNKCGNCGKIFKFASGLMKHECKICEFCGKSFSHKNNFQKHRQTHTGQKPHKCNECGRNFSQKSHLLNHVKIHGTKKEYKCEECSKEFRQHGGLFHHRFTHFVEKPFDCKDCGKRYTSKHNLKTHMRMSHSGERYECYQQCGKSFENIKSLKDHVHVCTSGGEKKNETLTCGKCYKIFSVRDDFVTHVLTHVNK